MTRAVNESRPGFSNERQSNRHGITIADRCALATRSAFDAVGLAQQLTDRDLGFARVALPFSDRVGDKVVQLEQSFAHPSQRSDPPKTFRPAKDRPSPAGRSAVGIMFENSPAVLHDEHGNAALTFGIFCRVRAIRRPNLRIDRCRSYAESEEDNERPATHDG